ncbi:ABC transporter domain-containing protein [Sarocladium implicatum]|nr:ABC transporter domain-containing protein [Sarocladium implicatum]
MEMDHVIQRSGRADFSPLSLDDLQIILTEPSESKVAQTAPWIQDLSSVARSGIPQAVVLAISLSILVTQLLTRSKISSHLKTKPGLIRWRYEIVSQVARAASLAFTALAFVDGRVHGLTLILVAYAFTLGLTRPLNHFQWRHMALHQVNFSLTLALILLAVGQFLPCIQMANECERSTSIIGATASLFISCLVAVNTPREWMPPLNTNNGIADAYDDPEPEKGRQPAAEETCSWLNYYCTYNWLTPIIWKGVKGELDMSGIPRLAWYDEPLHLLRKVQTARSIAGSTLWTTLRFQRTELCLMSFWVCLAFIVENVAPYGMYRLLGYLSNPQEATYHPSLWLALLFFGPVSRSLLYQQCVFVSTRLIVRVKSAMTLELYVKALATMEMEDDPFVSKDADPAEKDKKPVKTTSAGRLANLMASDVDAIYRARDIIHVVAGIPAGTIISFTGLYAMLGWVSIVGALVLTVGAPISFWLGRRMYFAQRRVRKAQDARISLVTEYLASIRAIKYFAWEAPITERIVEARASEQNQLWRVALLQTFVSQVTQIFPYLALLVMFGLHVGVAQKPLDASTAFTTILLVKNIRRNVMQASAFSRNFAAAWVSFRRLDKYFENAVPLVQYPKGPLRIENASFRRTKKATFSLEDISINFVEGGLNVVTGSSGSGKSTLLLAILGETYLEAGQVTKPEDVAFASQSAWLQNDTIKSNILFGSEMEQTRYDRILTACCLHPDLREVSHGDLTIIGENGTSLSGGQKARVALARALYSKAPVLLLDDIFSALDAKTAAGVWKHCFCSDLLRGRTVVLVTQIPWIAEQGDLSVVLDDGRVKSCEPNIGVVRTPIAIAEVLGGNTDDDEQATQVDSQPEPELQANGDPLNDPNKIAAEETPANVVNQEMRASSRASRLTYLQYLGYFGTPSFIFFVLFCMLISNIFTVMATYWLSLWSDAYTTSPSPSDVNAAFYMGFFALITFSEILSYAAIIVLFELGAWRAARRLHNDFIRAVMRVSLSWFKIIPIGRVTNRFAGDMASIDNSLPSLLRNLIDFMMLLLFRVAAISSIMPVFIVPSLFACVFGITLGEMYTRTAVVIKRLTSSAQSPIFSQFGDTLAGLPVVRARAGMAQAFKQELASKLRVWSASAETNYNCNRWIAVRVDFVTALVSLTAGAIAVSKAGVIGAGLVGFSLSNANGLSQTILMLVRSMNDLEVEMQSFHRVKEYVKLEPEEKHDENYANEGDDSTYTDDPDCASHQIPKLWPRTGEIEFRNVTIRYDPDGPNILTDVNLKFKAGQRVAVVGRTGSGKSTLILSLLRFTHIVSGQILYDGVDITHIPRRRLRESLTIIPQDPVLFNGTVGSNLDPSCRASPEVLQRALDNCRGIASFSDTPTPPNPSSLLDDRSDERPHAASGIQLDTEVDARGENFSHGQRQVLGLCRALIRGSKLMLLDEATASMDYETDRGIQQVLRRDLAASSESDSSDRTLVTIAHRLRTIIDYDSVIVMAAGRVVEYGSPKALYDARGQFYDMVFHSGELDDLQAILEAEPPAAHT